MKLRRNSAYYLLLLMVTSIVGCNLVNANITIEGIINDEGGLGIEDAEVVIFVWSEEAFDDINYKTYDIISGGDGKFKLEVESGSFIDIGATKKGYSAQSNRIEINNERLITTELKLIELSVNDSVNHSLGEDGKLVFLGFREIFDDNKLLVSTELYGIDVLKGVSKSSNDVDIFCYSKKEDKVDYLKAHDKGGIKPINSSDVIESLLFEHRTAPISGYYGKYKLDGNEEGFIVKCRDGSFGKLIISTLNYSSSTPDGRGGYYKDSGILFNYIHDKSNKGSFEIDLPFNLKNYLLKGADGGSSISIAIED